MIREELERESPNEILRTAVAKALKPMRDVIEKYGVQVGGVWRFKEEDADVVEPFPPPPPDPSIRYR
jgi:hypothetical protein